MADRCSADKIPRILNVPPPAVRHSSSMAHSPEIPSDSPEEPPAALPCTDESAEVDRRTNPPLLPVPGVLWPPR